MTDYPIPSGVIVEIGVGERMFNLHLSRIHGPMTSAEIKINFIPESDTALVSFGDSGTGYIHTVIPADDIRAFLRGGLAVFEPTKHLKSRRHG